MYRFLLLDSEMRTVGSEEAWLAGEGAALAFAHRLLAGRHAVQVSGDAGPFALLRAEPKSLELLPRAAAAA